MNREVQCPCGKKGHCGTCKRATQTRNSNILDRVSQRSYSYKPVCKEGYGIAVDIGTTTIVMYVMDFSDGCIKGVLSESNEQQSFGLDLMSRIQHCLDDPFKLQEITQKQMNRMIDKISKREQIKKEMINAVCITGNTVMQHIVLGYDVKGLAQAPFCSLLREGLRVQAKEIGLELETVWVYLPNMLSNFVGSDVAVGVLDCGIQESEKYSILVDIGTNAEIVMGNREKILACSVPAGPAFEGGQIACGVAGVEGAICRVERKEGVLHIETIGKKTPIGICGSGILDIIFLLLKEGVIDKHGHMKEETYAIIHDIHITQADVRAIQMAKAAVSAGIKTLLHEMNLFESEVERLYLCGGFGNFMNIASALGIGLIPKEFEDKIRYAGNTSGSGAIRILSEKGAFERIEQVKACTKGIELASNSFFVTQYIEEMDFI